MGTVRDDVTGHDSPYSSEGGGGGPGQFCWFVLSGGPAPGAGPVPIPWEASTDGVPAFTDAQVGNDPTLIGIVNGGPWHFNIQVNVQNTTGEPAFHAVLTVTLNDDSVGPLYNLNPVCQVPPDEGATASITLGIDVDLSDGDVLSFGVVQQPGYAQVINAVLSARRLG